VLHMRVRSLVGKLMITGEEREAFYLHTCFPQQYVLKEFQSTLFVAS
jgi:hypothetical protein